MESFKVGATYVLLRDNWHCNYGRSISKGTVVEVVKLKGGVDCRQIVFVALNNKEISGYIQGESQKKFWRACRTTVFPNGHPNTSIFKYN